VSLVRDTPTLQAVAVCTPTDAGALAAVATVHALIAAAPRRSHLHSVRLAAAVRGGAWVHLFQRLGVLPLYDGALAAAAAARLLATPATAPTVVLGAAPNNEELARLLGARVVEGPAYWRAIHLPLGAGPAAAAAAAAAGAAGSRSAAVTPLPPVPASVTAASSLPLDVAVTPGVTTLYRTPGAAAK